MAIANVKLTFESNEKEKRAAELAIANKILLFENKEKEKITEELAFAINELKKAEIIQKEHIVALEQIMFIISHKVRKPLANIIGICNLLEHNGHHTQVELKNIVQNMVVSAESLNEFTKELSTLIHMQRKHS